ncbi:MAG: hypothetical protein HY814_03805 [Candidatus Riflebacteria bacterium]|nr:hypothetical protein [Candidatus Riflebacteria bacterium]
MPVLARRQPGQPDGVPIGRTCLYATFQIARVPDPIALVATSAAWKAIDELCARATRAGAAESPSPAPPGPRDERAPSFKDLPPHEVPCPDLETVLVSGVGDSLARQVGSAVQQIESVSPGDLEVTLAGSRSEQTAGGPAKGSPTTVAQQLFDQRRGFAERTAQETGRLDSEARRQLEACAALAAVRLATEEQAGESRQRYEQAVREAKDWPSLREVLDEAAVEREVRSLDALERAAADVALDVPCWRDLGLHASLASVLLFLALERLWAIDQPSLPVDARGLAGAVAMLVCFGTATVFRRLVVSRLSDLLDDSRDARSKWVARVRDTLREKLAHVFRSYRVRMLDAMWHRGERVAKRLRRREGLLRRLAATRPAVCRDDSPLAPWRDSILLEDAEKDQLYRDVFIEGLLAADGPAFLPLDLDRLRRGALDWLDRRSRPRLEQPDTTAQILSSGAIATELERAVASVAESRLPLGRGRGRGAGGLSKMFVLLPLRLWNADGFPRTSVPPGTGFQTGLPGTTDGPVCLVQREDVAVFLVDTPDVLVSRVIYDVPFDCFCSGE